MATKAAGLPLGVKLAAGFLMIVGILGLLAGLAAGANPFGGLAFLIGVGATAGAVGLFRRARWGWITSVAVATLAVALDIVMFAGIVSIPPLVLHGVLLGYLLHVRALFLAPPATEGEWVDAT